MVTASGSLLARGYPTTSPRLARSGRGFFFLRALEGVSERCGVLGLGKRNAQHNNLFIFLARRFKHSTSGFVNPFANQIEQARE